MTIGDWRNWHGDSTGWWPGVSWEKRDSVGTRSRFGCAPDGFIGFTPASTP
jgi:hypothetical protein